MSAIWSTGSKTRAPLSNAPRCATRTTSAAPTGASLAALGQEQEEQEALGEEQEEQAEEEQEEGVRPEV